VKDKTLFEAWSDIKSEVTHFQIFGSCAWARVPFEKRKALDPQSRTCIFVGYPKCVKDYRLIDPSTDNIIIERSVQFEESPMQASQEPHVETSTPPLVLDAQDDASSHSHQNSDLIYESNSKYDEHANYDPHQFPKWAQSTLHAIGDLVGDPSDPRGRDPSLRSHHMHLQL
jgi:hypothetical protein